jgi:Xaa-Pro aminopeptidase
VAAHVDALVPDDPMLDDELARVASEQRLIKDDWEVDQLRAACHATTLGFEDCAREWDRVLEHGERWIEGTFFRRARTMGNDLGYDSIVGGGRHATTLHWIDNSGPITPGELVLLDMGVEGPNLYTADVTRTLPTSGEFTPRQRELYDLVLTAQQAGIDALRPGVPFSAGHDAAMSVIAHALEIVKRTGRNVIETIEQVKAAVEAERASWPETVEVSYFQDQSAGIRTMLADLQNNVISAVLLVMIVAMNLLGDRLRDVTNPRFER